MKLFIIWLWMRNCKTTTNNKRVISYIFFFFLLFPPPLDGCAWPKLKLFLFYNVEIFFSVIFFLFFCPVLIWYINKPKIMHSTKVIYPVWKFLIPLPCKAPLISIRWNSWIKFSKTSDSRSIYEIRESEYIPTSQSS
jgi:hypothetical protein